MTRAVFSFGAVLACAASFATEMDGKAKVLRCFDTVCSGKAEITCADPGAWTFDVQAGLAGDRDVVTVRIASPTNAVPPQFGVHFRVSGAGAQNVWNTDFCRSAYKLDPRLWWGWTAKYVSSLANNAPLAVAFNSAERSPVALACSETFEHVAFGLYADDRTCDMIGRCEFFTKAVVATNAYDVKVLLDRRGRYWADTVRDCMDWIVAENGFRAASVPEAAFEPLYSTWYAYLQDVHADELEREAKAAAALGMKVMILDDGWQKVESKGFYTACGDWMPVPSRFPDMKAHVAAVHRAGLKYMLWLSVPYMGNESKAYARFKGKFLNDPESDTGLLDPRFPEVRDYLISTYERAVGEWGFDGLKLDFIDAFVIPKTDAKGRPFADPALADDYAGRDYRSLPAAIDRLMKDVIARLKAIKPDVLVEFRQAYMGPAIRQYGNMIRAADCPADPCTNRRRICDLRLTSGDTAVHSDMLVWSRDESPEGAALPILNALFGVVQYSMILETVTPSHRDVIRHWIDFTMKHRKALLQGRFRPHHPENGYSWIEGESEDERVLAVYSSDVLATVRDASRPAFVVNATGTGALLVELPEKPAKVRAFDALGRLVPMAIPSSGISRLSVPESGHVEILFSDLSVAGKD